LRPVFLSPDGNRFPQKRGTKKPMMVTVRFWLISSGMFGMLQYEQKPTL